MTNEILEIKILPLIILSLMILFLIFKNQWNNYLNSLKQKRDDKAICKITKDSFLFPSGYLVRHSLLNNKKKLCFNSIQEVRINTFPPTAITKNNEVIFLFGLTREDIESSLLINKLKLTSPIDNWELICEEFLDTTFCKEHKEQTIINLENNGISKYELIKIRKKIGQLMLINTLFSLEWVYYGQYDVLQIIKPINSKKYWWTMEIALRNNKLKKPE